MMKREEMDEMVIDYLYDELPDAKRASFEAALPSFPELSREVQASSDLRAALRSIEPEPVPTELSQRILRIADSELRSPAQSGETFFQRIVHLFTQPAFATALVFLVVGGVTVLLGQQKTPQPAEEGSSFTETNSSPPPAVVADSAKPEVITEPAPPAAEASPVMVASKKPAPATTSKAAPPAGMADSVTAGSSEANAGLVPSSVAAAPKPKPSVEKVPQPKKPVNIRLADSKQTLYAESKKGGKKRRKKSKSSNNANLALLGSTASKQAQKPSTDAPPISLGTPPRDEPKDSKKVARKAPKRMAQKTSKNSSPKTQQTSLDRRLIKAFERALKKRQFGEARKLLGLMERRPGLSKIVKKKRSLLLRKKKEAVSPKQ